MFYRLYCYIECISNVLFIQDFENKIQNKMNTPLKLDKRTPKIYLKKTVTDKLDFSVIKKHHFNRGIQIYSPSKLDIKGSYYQKCKCPLHYFLHHSTVPSYLIHKTRGYVYLTLLVDSLTV